jgi:putative nucleotidyltransferase with HDIG domain
MEQGVAVLCPDLMADERYRDGDRVALDHIRSVLCAPLETGGRVVGALYLDTSSEDAAFDEHSLNLLLAASRQVGLALHRAQLVEDLERLFVGAIETLVATVEAKDIYTYGHSARVSKLGRQIAEHMGLSEEERERIKLAGLLHDIGKIGIPESILTKPAKLTDEEWEYVRSHPQIGESIIRQMGSDRLAEVQRLVRHHHERTDGSGYPDGLRGEAIPLGARILGVADAYDAMTSNRPYRTPFTAEAAVAELHRNAGRQFDRRAVEALVAIRADRLPAVAETVPTHSGDEG